MTQSKEAKVLYYASPAAMIRVFQGFLLLRLFVLSGDYIEINLPWQLMNFADPSKMLVHDDYYDGDYGIEYIRIDKMYAGIGTGADRICEILLFNLRKNCNRIFGTDKQIMYCDIHSMNRVQEEKKITESILKGFENNEFKMYLQFIVDNRTKKLYRQKHFQDGTATKKG